MITYDILIVLILILTNGVFAMAEIAVVSARKTRLQQMAAAGDSGAQTALELSDSPTRFLSTVQVGITLVGIFAGAFGGATVARELAPLLEGLPVIGRYSTPVSFGFVVALITYLSVVLGELVPKRLALQDAERVASLVARPMHTISVAATPIVRLLSLSTELVLRLLGVSPAAAQPVSEEEIRVLVEQGARAGIIEAAERDMVESVFRFADRRLGTMMTPRTEIVWLDINDDAETVRRTIEEAAHSRFPVCDGDLDNVVGIIRAREMLARNWSGERLDLKTMVEKPLFLPETMLGLKALERFRQTGTHLGLLIDEFGGIEGLVTLIDILEAIVGDIPTPDEMEEPPIVQRADGTWLVDGLLLIDDFKRQFDVGDVPAEGSYQTLAGFVVLMIGHIPSPGETFVWDQFRFEVLDMDGNRVDKVLVEPLKDGAVEATDDEV